MKTVLTHCHLISDLANNFDDDTEYFVLEVPGSISIDQFIEYLKAKSISRDKIFEVFSTADFLDIHDHIKGLVIYLDDFTGSKSPVDLQYN